MTNISEADEREMRTVLEFIAKNGAQPLPACDARTILALLDRPTLPKSANEIPDKVVERVAQAFWDDDGETLDATRRGLDVLWQWLAQPPAPMKVEAWTLRLRDGRLHGVYSTKEEALLVGNELHFGSRIVRLVEDCDGR